MWRSLARDLPAGRCRAFARTPTSEGTTTMRNNYQTNASFAATDVVLPDAVSVTLTELAGAVKQGLLALAVGVGLQVMQAVMDDNVTALCGPKGRHDPDRTAVRHGDKAGNVT